MRYLATISYDGSKFYGYQVQKNKITVEGEIERVLSKLLNTKVNSVGSSSDFLKLISNDSSYIGRCNTNEPGLSKMTAAIVLSLWCLKISSLRSGGLYVVVGGFLRK